MHANSLQILVLLVAQVTPGSEASKDDSNPPALAGPPGQSQPDDAIAPPVPAADVPPDVPPTALPADLGNQFRPSESAPAAIEDAVRPSADQPVPADRFQVQPRPADVPGQPTGNAAGGAFPARSAPLEFAPLKTTPPAATPSVLERSNPPELRSSETPSERPAGQVLHSQVDAKTVLHRALERPADQATVSERRMRLREALERSTLRSEQIAVVKSYWRLAVAEADFNHADDELSLLFSLPEPGAAHEKKQLTAAVQVAKARRAEAQLALLIAQHELTATSKSPSDSVLPLAGDAPLVGPYKTRIDQMFSGRTAPHEIRRLDQSLPLYHDLLDARAGSVAAAEDALIELADAYPRGFSYGEIIDAFLELRDQRIAFLVAVRDYNNAIADYSLNTIGSGLSLDAIVATLIEIQAAPSVLISSGVRPASGQQPIRTAGQPTPATRSLVPVAQPKDGLVPTPASQTKPDQSTPKLPSAPTPTLPGQFLPNASQETPKIPQPAPNGFDFQR